MSGEELRALASDGRQSVALTSTTLLALLDERDALRAAYDDLEAARLETMDQRNEARAALERVRALADEWESERDAVCCGTCQAAVEARHGASDDLRDALGPQ